MYVCGYVWMYVSALRALPSTYRASRYADPRSLAFRALPTSLGRVHERAKSLTKRRAPYPSSSRASRYVDQCSRASRSAVQSRPGP